MPYDQGGETVQTTGSGVARAHRHNPIVLVEASLRSEGVNIAGKGVENKQAALPRRRRGSATTRIGGIARLDDNAQRGRNLAKRARTIQVSRVPCLPQQTVSNRVSKVASFETLNPRRSVPAGTASTLRLRLVSIFEAAAESLALHALPG